ncbi:MAG TPA: hypothetical protein VND22_07630 [Actinomycetota bacterium]|nr:hypothetical protein [Actinomycetota bacterium]
MIEQIRSALQLASSLAEIPKQKAEKLARQIAGGGTKSTQVGAIAEEIVKRSKENAKMAQSVISSEVRRQMKTLGLATRDDVDRISRRVFGLATKDEFDRLSKRISALEEKAKTPARSAGASRPRQKAAPGANKAAPPSRGSSS